MSVKLKITVTKEILEKSKRCGMDMANCAISQAIRDVFPDAITGFSYIIPFSFCSVYSMEYDVRKQEIKDKRPKNNFISLPESASEFIHKFDDTLEESRPDLPEFSFEIELANEIIDRINIDELRPLFENHPNLALM